MGAAIDMLLTESHGDWHGLFPEGRAGVKVAALVASGSLYE